MNAVQLLAELSDRPDVPSDGVLADLPGWDSLKMVRLVLALEGSIGRELEESEVESLESVSDVQRLLEECK